MRCLIVVAAALLLLPMQLHATTWHVRPWESIQDHIDMASPGDNVVVHGEGLREVTYYESITLSAGVSVYTVAEEPNVTIHGQDSDQTVYATGDMEHEGQPTVFGGAGTGFTIDGGSRYGVNLFECGNLELTDLKVISNPSSGQPAAVRCRDFWSLGEPVRFENLQIHGQTECYGMMLYNCGDEVVIDGGDIHDISSIGIWFEACHPLTLQSVNISNCDRGINPVNASLNYQGGYVTNCADRGIFASTSVYGDPLAIVTLNGVAFENCGTAVSAHGSGMPWPPYWPFMEVDIQNCEVRFCEDGFDFIRCHGFVQGCTFRDIYDTGLMASRFSDQWWLPGFLHIGGATPEARNTFTSIDGIGVLLGSQAMAVVRSDFIDIAGTAIQCATFENSGSLIHASDIDGMYTGECFEGIASSGDGTMVKVRACDIANYKSPGPISPPLRGSYAYEATADYGMESSSSPGNNDFLNNKIDFWYAGPPHGDPEYIYAQRNYWGEYPPDTGQSFNGNWKDYIVWDPANEGETRGGTSSGLGSSPSVSVLHLIGVRPNPSVGHIEFSYDGPVGNKVAMAIWDLQGRLIKNLITVERIHGQGVVHWDGIDQRGAKVPTGVYLCTLSGDRSSCSKRFVLLR